MSRIKNIKNLIFVLTERVKHIHTKIIPSGYTKYNDNPSALPYNYGFPERGWVHNNIKRKNKNFFYLSAELK